MRSRVITAHLDESIIPIGFFAMTMISEPEYYFENDPSILSKVKDLIYKSSLITLHLKWVAVDINYHRRGIGTLLMGHALDNFHRVADMTGVSALTLKPINKSVATFYATLGFTPYGQDNPRRMFLAADILHEIHA
jgi:GNAT superfamily N-acetyltransferase